MKPNVSAWVIVLVLCVVTATAAPVVGDERPRDTDGASDSPVLAGRQAAEPDIEVRPVTLRFPNESESETETRTLSLRNVGNASLTVRGLAIVGPDSSSFGSDFEGSETLEPGEYRNVTVTFDGGEGRPRFATLHVMSDDPNQPQTNVWLTTTETVADVSPSRVLETRTLVNASVRNASANTTQSLNLSWPLTRDDRFAIDALSFTPERGGDVTLSVATNASRFGDVPAFERADGTEPAGFLHVEHSIANENVRDVTLRLRVRRSLLAENGTNPDDVAVYRHENGTWTELPTRLVGTGGTHYFFEAEAPGLSDFATGIKRAKFRIVDAVVTVTRIRTDEGTEVLVRVRNVGAADGTYAVTLRLDDDVVDRRELSIAPNGTRQATFERSFDAPGTYEVFVNERFVGDVTVADASTASESPTADTGPTTGTASTTRDDGSSGGDGSGTEESVPGFTAVTAGAALLAALLYAVGRRSR